MSTWIDQRRFCVNRSSQTLTIHEAIAGFDSQGNPTHFPGVVVGQVRPDDFFRWCGNDSRVGSWTIQRNGVWISQRRSSVMILEGTRFVSGSFGIEDIQNQPSFFNPVVTHRRGTVVWQGQTLHTFLTQNRPAMLINHEGHDLGPIISGTWIAADPVLADSVMGATRREYWRIYLVARNNVWTWANQPNNSPAFIDTGLTIGDRPDTITIRTSLVP